LYNNAPSIYGQKGYSTDHDIKIIYNDCSMDIIKLTSSDLVDSVLFADENVTPYQTNASMICIAAVITRAILPLGIAYIALPKNCFDILMLKSILLHADEMPKYNNKAESGEISNLTVTITIIFIEAISKCIGGNYPKQITVFVR